MASICGVVVAVVSGVTGVVAHGMASDHPMALTSQSALAVLVACGAVGFGTARLIARCHPGLAVTGGLVAAQGAVHYALHWTHGSHASGHGGHPSLGHEAHLLYTPAERARIVQEAMEAGAGAPHGGMTWSMLAAHVGATLVAGGALALIAAMLGWLSARAERLAVPEVVVYERLTLPLPSVEPRAFVSHHLVSRGAVRGPPISV